jgi:Tol biopolymer transport system component/tRNA A-37 threonylcarbamoyl transferase component Bud32
VGSDLSALLAAILDGSPVDWNALEAAHPDDRDLISALKAIGEVGRQRRDERQVWGPLEVLELVGEGSSASVYKARDPRLDRIVALKILYAAESNTTGIVNEGRLMARVRHPSVAAVYGADCVDGEIGIWMEFVEGQTLEQLVRSQGHLTAAEAATIGAVLCDALDAIHAAGLIHGDVKAQNVMIEPSGRLVLMDIGAGRAAHSRVPAVSGTPAYLAPEILAGAPPSRASDIYAVAALLFHTLTGTYPITGSTVEALAEAHRLGVTSSWRASAVPSTLERIVDQGLASNPEDRFHSAAEFAASLRRWTRGRHARRLVIAYGGVLALLVAATGTLLFRLHGEVRPPRSALNPQVSLRQLPMPPMRVVGGPSRDGRFLGFAAQDGNVRVLDLVSGQSWSPTDALHEAGAAEVSALSPDDSSIAYAWSGVDNVPQLRVIPIRGGQWRTLLRDSAVSDIRPVEWSRDGEQLLVLLYRIDQTIELAIVNARDGHVSFRKDMTSARPRHASLSSDGKYLAYDAPQDPDSAQRDIRLIQLRDGTESVLVSHPANDVYPMWTDDGTRLVFASDRSGSLDLWSMRVSEGRAVGPPQLAVRNIGRVWPLGLTATGSWYCYRQTSSIDVYTAMVAARNGAAITPNPIATDSVGLNHSAAWSSDGRRLAYVSNRGLVPFDRGYDILNIIDLSTGDRRELHPKLASFAQLQWSPDDRRLVVKGRDFDGQFGLFLINLATGGVEPVVLTGDRPRSISPSPIRDRRARQTVFVSGATIGAYKWSPDGTALWYVRGREGIVALDLATGTETLVLDFREEKIMGLNPGGPGFKVSPDGTLLAFGAWGVDNDSGLVALRVRPLRGGPTQELVRAREGNLRFQDWSRDSQRILCTRSHDDNDASLSLWEYPIDRDAPRPLDLTLPRLRDVAMHPDGHRIAFTAGTVAWELCVVDHAVPGSRMTR